MQLVYENLNEDRKVEESKHEFKVDLNQLATSF